MSVKIRVGFTKYFFELRNVKKKLEDLFARFQKFNRRDFVGIVSCSILYLLELFVNGSINWPCIQAIVMAFKLGGV